MLLLYRVYVHSYIIIIIIWNIFKYGSEISKRAYLVRTNFFRDFQLN